MQLLLVQLDAILGNGDGNTWPGLLRECGGNCVSWDYNVMYLAINSAARILPAAFDPLVGAAGC